MKPHGCVMLVALASTGCVGSLGQKGPIVSAAAIERCPTAPRSVCLSPIEPGPPSRAQPAVEAPTTGTAIGPDSARSTLPVLPIASLAKAETTAPAALPEPDNAEPVTAIEPPTAIVEVAEPPEPVPPVVEVALVEPPKVSQPAVAPARPEPTQEKGRPVASVGAEIISLPELTEATKARITQLGTNVAPNRRQVITLAKETLKAMIVRSLIIQEALAKLGGPERLGDLETRAGRIWADRELSGLMRREGVTTESELRAKLAPRLTTLEAVREEFLMRSLAAELILLDHLDLDYDAYLDTLRKLRPVRSIMTPAELMAAGRRAATDETSRR